MCWGSNLPCSTLVTCHHCTMFRAGRPRVEGGQVLCPQPEMLLIVLPTNSGAEIAFEVPVGILFVFFLTLSPTVGRG